MRQKCKQRFPYSWFASTRLDGYVGVQNNRNPPPPPRIFCVIIVKLPKDTSLHCSVLQYGRRDVTCKPTIPWRKETSFSVVDKTCGRGWSQGRGRSRGWDRGVFFFPIYLFQFLSLLSCTVFIECSAWLLHLYCYSSQHESPGCAH